MVVLRLKPRQDKTITAILRRRCAVSRLAFLPSASCRTLIFTLLVILLALPVPLDPASAQVKAKLDAVPEDGFGRIIFEFDRMPKYSHTVTGTILALDFGESVVVDLSRVNNEIRDYVSIARRDPDGRAVRFALTKRYRVNLMEAGTKLFVDLIPRNWVGLPPSLPKKVIARLARLTAEAERRSKEEARQRELSKKGYKLKVRTGRHPTFSRIVFDWNKFVSAKLTREGTKVTLAFGLDVPTDLGQLKADPPPFLKSVKRVVTNHGMQVIMKVNAETNVRGFREGFDYVIDLSGPKADLEAAAEGALKAAEKALNAVDRAKKGKTEESSSPEEKIKLSGEEEESKTPPGKETKDKPFAPKIKGFDRSSAAEDISDEWQQTVKETQKQSSKSDNPDAGSNDDWTKKTEITIEPSGPAKDISNNETLPPVTKDSSAAERKTPQTTKLTQQKTQPGKTADVAVKPAKMRDRSETEVDGVKADESAAGALALQVKQKGDGLKLKFPFEKPVAAAVFRRARTIWIVLDTDVIIDYSAIKTSSEKLITGVQHSHSNGSHVFRLQTSRPWLTYATVRGNAWTIELGDLISGQSQPLGLKRGLRSDRRSVVTISYKKPGKVHWLPDSEIGDRLAVVTAFAPARNLIKPQNLVDFSALATAHGVVIKPHADDLAVRLRIDDILITRKAGLALSAGSAHQYEPGKRSLDQGKKPRTGFIDFEKWQQGGVPFFNYRTGELIRAIALAKGQDKNQLRLELARLYMSHQLAPEVLGILKQITTQDPGAKSDPSLNILRGAANTMMGRTKAAHKDLDVHALSYDDDAALWRGLLETKDKNWKEALKNFQSGSPVISDYPHALQAIFRLAAAEAALNTQMLGRTADELDAIPAVNLPRKLLAQADLMRGRYLQNIGRTEEALGSYKRSAASGVKSVEVQARLNGIRLMLNAGTIEQDKAIEELEKLSVTWRGDDIELDTVRLLAKLNAEKGNYRVAFQLMKNTLWAFPKSQLALQIQDDMKEVFRDLFLYGKGDKMEPVASLGLFYDYREMTPVGRLGDEMIRRLADRLVMVDLLDQAAELLDHQVSNRLKGAARAQVATRLAMVHLSNRKPELALRAIRHTRQPDLPKVIRRQRDILEARALGELGRAEGAIDILSKLEGDEIERLRADVYWNTRKWAKAGEQIEKMLGLRWQQQKPLSKLERFDILRAGISYSLANDTFALDRLHKKYYTKMVKSADAESFILVTKPIKSRGKDFNLLVKEIASISTLDAFMKEFREKMERQKKKDGKSPKKA